VTGQTERVMVGTLMRLAITRLSRQLLKIGEKLAVAAAPVFGRIAPL